MLKCTWMYTYTSVYFNKLENTILMWHIKVRHLKKAINEK